MTRLSQLLFAATALALPLTAYAEDPGASEVPADPTTGGGSAATPTPESAPDWSRAQIERPLTLRKGKLGALADLYIFHATPEPILGMTQDSVTSEGLAVGAGYGILDKLEAGGSYAFALNEFEIKGIFTAYGAYALVRGAKLDIGVSADLAIDLSKSDAKEAIHAGAAVRYRITPKMAVFTGTPNKIGTLDSAGPSVGGPLGQHLTLRLNDGDISSFSIPVGFGFQAIPELFAYVNTNLVTFRLSNVPDGQKSVLSIADVSPLSLGALYSVNKNIDAAVSFSFFDLQNAGDTYLVTIGARYYN